MYKRGISNVVATVLIVLLSLAAVVVVWQFIGPLIENLTSGANLDTYCLTTKAKANNCIYNSTSNETTIRFELTTSPDPEITVKAKPYITLSDGSTSEGEEVELTNLNEEKQVIEEIETIPSIVNVKTIITNDKGKSRVCPVTTTNIQCKSVE